MKVLFMSLGVFDDLSEGSVHIDLAKRLAEENEVYLLCKTERRNKKETQLTKEHGINVLRVKTGNVKNTNIIEKGISTVLVEPQFKAAVKKYLSDVCFDIVIYTTPPITFANVVEYIKKRDNAVTYLLLKDIFPQNAIDIGIMSKSGVKGLLYKHFRNKERELYRISDYIGCMSPGNCRYILKNNKFIDSNDVEVCPNSIYIKDIQIDNDTKNEIRKKYGIPNDKKVFVYGGNLGKPQGIPYMLDCLKEQAGRADAFFVIVGVGTEYGIIEEYLNKEKPDNILLMPRIPRDDYDKMICACDVGMIFLDYRFTIPNIPSRLLSYMQARLPVFACTDVNTDLGDIILDGDFGWWCRSDDVNAFSRTIDKILSEDIAEKGMNGYRYLCNNYSVDNSYRTIMKHCK